MGTAWNLDQLKSELKQRHEIKGWIITQEHTHRRERYFMHHDEQLITDQDRDVHMQNINLKIMVRLPAKADRQGEMTKKLFSSMPIGPQIDSAIEAALQTDHQSWDLPKELPEKIAQKATTDPRMAEDLEGVMSELSRKIRASVEKARATAFNSAELFLSVHNRELHLSSGLIHRSSQSRIYTEAAYSMSKRLANGETQSDEYLNTAWAVNIDDLPIEKLFNETSERAEHSLDVRKPDTGKFSVIVDSEVLATLLNGHVSQLSSINAYHGLPFVKPGDSLVPNLMGDAMTITLDPSVDFGADTISLSDAGILQNPLTLVKENKVVATATEKQYADYLKLSPTTSRGNVVLNPGKHSYEELTRSAPKVLEVLQFSALFADPNSGTFSSEIRLARVFDNSTGKVTYVKGGSLSGSINENFRGLKLSKNLVKRAQFSANSPVGHGYYGPDYALLSDVSIVG